MRYHKIFIQSQDENLEQNRKKLKTPRCNRLHYYANGLHSATDSKSRKNTTYNLFTYYVNRLHLIIVNLI